ncbi:MAG: hypothetical protein RBT16_14825, partial [Desulfococcus multivorans]|nr:hypothetical protein [Desulfococcus multivorans]
NPKLVSALSSEGMSVSRRHITGSPSAEASGHDADVSRAQAGTTKSVFVEDGESPSAEPDNRRSADALKKNGALPTAARFHRRRREAPADAERISRLSPSGKASKEFHDDEKIFPGSEANIVLIHTEADENGRADPISMHHGRSDAEPGGRDDGAVQFEDRPWPRLPDEEPIRSGADDRSGLWPLLLDETQTRGRKHEDRAAREAFRTALREHVRLQRLEKEQEGEIWNAWPF